MGSEQPFLSLFGDLNFFQYPNGLNGICCSRSQPHCLRAKQGLKELHYTAIESRDKQGNPSNRREEALLLMKLIPCYKQ